MLDPTEGENNSSSDEEICGGFSQKNEISLNIQETPSTTNDDDTDQ